MTKKNHRKRSKLLVSVSAAALILTAAFSGIIKAPDTVPEASDNREILKIELFDRSSDVNGFGIYDSAELMEWIQHDFGDPNNVEIEFVTASRGNETEELNKYLASGSGPDIVFTYNPYYFGSYAKNGMLTDLTELIDAHGGNIKALVGSELLQSGQIGGRQYAVPAKRMFTGKYVSYIRKDWLDALGLEVPKTTDELVNALVRFRELDNDGSLIPFSSQYGNSAAIKTILQNFCMENEYSETAPFSDPDYKRGLEFLNELYNSGLLGSGYASDIDSVAHYTNISEGKVGFFTDSLSASSFNRLISICELMKTNDPDAELVVCDAITNSGGKHFKEVNPDSGMYIFVPAYSTKAELAVKYLDWLSRPDVIRTLQNGVTDNGNLSVSFDLCLTINGFYADTADESITAESKTYGEYSQLFLDACRSSVTDGFRSDISPEEIIKNGNADRISGIIDKYVTQCITAAPESFDRIYEQSAAQFAAETAGL